MQASLFTDQQTLLFPGDVLRYYPGFLDSMEALRLLDELQTTVPWRQPVLTIAGRQVMTPRLTAWYGDGGVVEEPAGTRQRPYPWTESLLKIRRRVAEVSGVEATSVLLNYYRDGKDSVAWHSDSESWLDDSPVISSVSLGEERPFEFRRKADHRSRYRLVLANGSLLVMQGPLQRDWEHRIPKSSLPMIPRINLTFRKII